MSVKKICAGMLLTGSVVASGLAVAEDNAAFVNEMDKVSYAIGVQYGKGFKRDLKEVNIDQLSAGFKDGFNGGELKMNEQEIAQTLSAFEQKKVQAMKQEREKMASKNLAAGQEFLKKNGSADGFKTTDSGLQYKVVEKGSGKMPTLTDRVQVHYTGRLINGTVFDSSVQRGVPAEFPVNGVIKGWTEALQMMEEGAKWQLAIPSDLAYGENGTRGGIGPNEVLLFDVELIAIQ